MRPGAKWGLMMGAVSGNAMFDPWLAGAWWLAQMAAASRSPFGAFSLSEPVLPNGTFAGIVINENNSTDPRVEHAIVTRESYGRQLGRMMDAVAVLIDERPAAAKSSDALSEFERLKRTIDGIKERGSHDRFERVKTDLEWLRKNADGEYRGRVQELKALIEKLG